ncbi:hypothetical protein DNTS_030378 [Danionella cerebrum]|uniref:Uncharacterized protein n=1 Tax=Danionella cerebrum TaxID=2873325 RepID=A0A553QWD8_9TELE|nr:hypothetical protein DNTS_030378 [Danionella translucida]
MNRVWALFRSHPYISNVVGYTALFATADFIQQNMMGKDTERELKVLEVTTSTADGLTHDNCRRTAPVSQFHSIDWTQMARVALVGFCFHANFNYHWLRALERMVPGGGPKRVSMKVFLDQLIASPLTISAFYIGLSSLEGAEDPFEDWRSKFWTSYKTGVVYWSTMQAVNFSLVPLVARTVFVGGVALVWTVFLCHCKQQKSQHQS